MAAFASLEAAMNTRILSILFAASAAMTLSSADGAVSVVGNGPAQLCYQAADSGASPFDYLSYCDEALAGSLTRADRAATFVNRGVLKLSMHAVDAAASDFNAGLAINGDLGEAYVDLGAVLIARKRYAEAIPLITRGLKLGTKEPQNAYYDRAVASEAIGNLQGAYDDYRQAVSIAPNFTKASDELKRFKVVEKPSGV
jgi:tetratricopeptide (TPR) repeat protein